MTGGLGSIPQRVAQRAELRAAGRRDAIIRAAEDLGIGARAEGDTVVLEGRGLLARWLHDARLRNIGMDA